MVLRETVSFFFPKSPDVSWDEVEENIHTKDSRENETN